MNKIIKRLYRVAVSALLVIGSIAYTPANVLATTGEPGTVTIDKTRDAGHEGVFEITLSIDGVPKITPTDIILVIDTSESMQGSRMTSAKNVASNFVDEVLSWNQGHKIGVVSFASDPAVRQGLTDNKSSLKSAINALSATGGTHIEGGIKLANEMLDTGSPSGRNKAIVLMSDGEPTYGYEFDLGIYTGPGSVKNKWTWPCELTVSPADSNDFENNYTGNRYNFDYSTSVGSRNSMTFTRIVSSDQSCSPGSTATFTKTINLKDSVVWHANQAINAGYDIFSIGLEVNAAGADVLQASQNKGYFTATDANLQTIYGMIAGQISLAATDAVVTDEIGAHFDFVGISDDYSGENTSYDSTTRILTWNVGNVGEQQRVLKYKVRLHNDAPGGNWPTNEWAHLDYVDINDTPQTKEFPKPEVPVGYIVELEANPEIGGSVSGEGRYNPGDTVNIVATANAGFTFTGWSEDGGSGNSSNTSHSFTMPSNNVKWIANFAENANITINYEAETGGIVSLDSETIGPVTGVAEGSLATPHPGYSFVRWTKDNIEVSTVPEFTPEKVNGLNIAATYFANFRPIDYTLTINYIDVEGNTLETSYVNTTMHVNDSYSVPSPIVPGYLPRTAIVTGQMDAEDKMIDVIYDAIDYSFTFVPNGGEQDTDIQGFNVGGSVVEPVFTRDGYDFVGWTWDVNGLDDYVDGFTELNPKDVTVYAQWIAIDYTFTFDPNWGDEDNVEQIFNVGGGVPGTVFSRTGFSFAGWTIDEEGETPYGGGLTNLPAEDIYVYAQWEAIDYTFTFDPNYGEEDVVEQIFNVGGSVEGTSFTRTGYDFVGWTTDALGANEYIGGLTNLPAQDIYVYAQWEAIDYTFTFDPNYGEEDVVEQIFNVGGSVEGVSFTRAGFVFNGWTVDAEGLSAYTGGLSNLPAQDITVYAQWQELAPEEFVLTFVTNQPGLTIPSVVFIEGEAVVEPQPEFEGFVFLGWYADEDLLVEFDQFDSMPAEDVTVYADWGQVLGEEEEFEEEEEETLVPDMSDQSHNDLGLLLFILGLLVLLMTRKEEELE